MKNVCILFKNSKCAYSEAEYLPTLLNAFSSKGYVFDEVRLLFHGDENSLRSILEEYKQSYQNVILCTEKAQAPLLKRAIPSDLRQESFSQDESVQIYQSANCAMVLLAPPKGKSLVDCAQAVCIPYLNRKYGERQEKIVVRCVGASELRVEQLIAQAENVAQGKLRILHTRYYAEDVIRILYGENASKMLLDDVLRLFADGLGDTVYALEDVPLHEQLVRLLKLRSRKISVAESFTGGGIAKKITSVSGASEVYFEGLNTYSENSKIKRLGVLEYTLKTAGAVSDQTAYEMAAGLIATGDCDISIATTGLAGPNTDRSMLPVGLCYIAIGDKEKVYVYRYKFDGTREEITNRAIQYALFLAYKQLKNM